MFRSAFFLFALPLCAGTPVESLFQPQATFAYRIATPPKEWDVSTKETSLVVKGPAAVREGTVRLVPGEKGSWDISAWSHLGLKVKNLGSSLLWIEGRLDNKGAQDWANSSASQSFLLPGETATLGFPFPRKGDLDDSPAAFAGMNGKLNGWRSHWKAFDPAHVRQLRLRIHSAQPGVHFELGPLSGAWAFGSKANAGLEEFPFLDQFGQVRQLDWPGKTKSLADLLARAKAESEQLEGMPRSASFNKFGGWNDGPQLEATGHFRLTKHQGKWWFVDPDGRLFWSHGVCSVGFSAGTPLDNRSELFAWVPAADDPLYATAIGFRKGKQRIDYFRANLHRKFGPDWIVAAGDLIHRRFASWGLNTLGAWSDASLQSDQRTPYTPVFHVGYPQLDERLPQPYGDALSNNIRKALQNFADEHGQDPWVVGVFIDNEIHWPGDLAAKVLGKPAANPAKAAAVKVLKSRHQSIGKLNKLWSTQFADWNGFAKATGHPWTEARRADFEAIQFAYAKRYYSVCEEAVRAVLPGKLYLGSRIHHCPDFVSRAAAEHVDIFSVNHYWNTAGLGRAPGEIDIPVIITEFHFGAVDRGVPGASLGPVHDQRARARAYQNYVASALAHPRIVGTHLFAWSDQSSAGRPGENYQFGLVDITDRPYPEFTGAVSAVGKNLYKIRSKSSPDYLSMLEACMKK